MISTVLPLFVSPPNAHPHRKHNCKQQGRGWNRGEHNPVSKDLSGSELCPSSCWAEYSQVYNVAAKEAGKCSFLLSIPMSGIKTSMRKETWILGHKKLKREGGRERLEPPHQTQPPALLEAPWPKLPGSKVYHGPDS